MDGFLENSPVNVFVNQKQTDCMLGVIQFCEVKKYSLFSLHYKKSLMTDLHRMHHKCWTSSSEILKEKDQFFEILRIALHFLYFSKKQI